MYIYIVSWARTKNIVIFVKVFGRKMYRALLYVKILIFSKPGLGKTGAKNWAHPRRLHPAAPRPFSPTFRLSEKGESKCRLLLFSGRESGNVKSCGSCGPPVLLQRPNSWSLTEGYSRLWNRVAEPAPESRQYDNPMPLSLRNLCAFVAE